MSDEILSFDFRNEVGQKVKNTFDTIIDTITCKYPFASYVHLGESSNDCFQYDKSLQGWLWGGRSVAFLTLEEKVEIISHFPEAFDKFREEHEKNQAEAVKVLETFDEAVKSRSNK